MTMICLSTSLNHSNWRKKCLQTDNLKTWNWNFDILHSQKDLFCSGSVFSVTQMWFSKPWNFLFQKYVEPTEFLKEIIYILNLVYWKACKNCNHALCKCFWVFLEFIMRGWTRETVVLGLMQTLIFKRMRKCTKVF